MPRRETIMCVCAHSDDQIFGPGGTLAKYAKEGKRVFTVIFSYGELSHPHFKKDVIIRTRIKEAKEADEVIGGSGVIFLGLKEGKFREESKEKQTARKLADLFRIHQPTKIFTHASDDPHPDHRAVCDVVKRAYDKSKLSCPLYTFDVWTPFSTKKRNAPRLVVDVTETFRLKVEAVKCFKSQLGILQSLNWYVYASMLFRGVYFGLKHGFRFAEVFYKLR